MRRSILPYSNSYNQYAHSDGVSVPDSSTSIAATPLGNRPEKQKLGRSEFLRYDVPTASKRRVHFGDVRVLLEPDCNNAKPKELCVGKIEQFPGKERVCRYASPKKMESTVVGLALQIHQQPIRFYAPDAYVEINKKIDEEMHLYKEMAFRQFVVETKVNSMGVYTCATSLAEDVGASMKDLLRTYCDESSNTLLDMSPDACRAHLKTQIEQHLRKTALSYDVSYEQDPKMSTEDKLKEFYLRKFSNQFFKCLAKSSSNFSDKLSEVTFANLPGRAERIVRDLSGIFG